MESVTTTEHGARAVLRAARILEGTNSGGISELESGLATFEGLDGGSQVLSGSVGEPGGRRLRRCCRALTG